MNKTEIVNVVKKNFGENLDKVTLLGRASLVISGLETSTDKIVINYADKNFVDSIPIVTEYNGEEYKMYDEDILVCCKNMTVYQTGRLFDGFSVQSVSSAITYLRDQTGFLRYNLMNKETISDEDKKTLKRMLNYLKVMLPEYAKYKKANKG